MVPPSQSVAKSSTEGPSADHDKPTRRRSRPPARRRLRLGVGRRGRLYLVGRQFQPQPIRILKVDRVSRAVILKLEADPARAKFLLGGFEVRAVHSKRDMTNERTGV